MARVKNKCSKEIFFSICWRRGVPANYINVQLALDVEAQFFTGLDSTWVQFVQKFPWEELLQDCYITVLQLTKVLDVALHN